MKPFRQAAASLICLSIFIVSCSGVNESPAVLADDIPITAAMFEDHVLIEVASTRLIEVRTTSVSGRIQEAIYEGTVVAVHSDRQLRDLGDDPTVRFYSPHWTSAGPILDQVDPADRLYLMLRTKNDREGSIEQRGTALVADYAFTSRSDGLELVSVPRNYSSDTVMLSTIVDSLKAVESAGLIDQDLGDIGSRVGAMLDEFNDPTSGVRELLLPRPVVTPDVVDRIDQLLADPGYAVVEVGGVHVGGGDFFVRLQTKSGVDTGLAVSPKTRFTSATVPLAPGEAMEISVWTDENDAFVTEPVFELSYIPDIAPRDDRSPEVAVLLDIGAADALVAPQTTTLDAFFQSAIENQGTVEIGAVTDSDS